MKISLDARCMTRRKEAHAYLREKMNFPAYYGNNLDALHDCLTEIHDTTVTFENKEEAGAYFEKVYKVFLKAGEENAGLRIENCG